MKLKNGISWERNLDVKYHDVYAIDTITGDIGATFSEMQIISEYAFSL